MLGLNTTNGPANDQPSINEGDDLVGIWDGKEFVVILDDSLSWWSIGKLLWKYGLAPIRTKILVKKTLDKFLKIYEAPIFPFESLTDAVGALGLSTTVSQSGSFFLKVNGISSAFASVIQSSTRVNYGQNLGLIHGIGTMVCMSTGNAMSIKGGNWLIFDGLLKAAGADVRLNQTVTSIKRNPDNSLTVDYGISGEKKETMKSSTFDDVIITGPMQYSSITFSPPPTNKDKEEVMKTKTPFVTLYVTLFATTHKISPKFFGLRDTDSVPGTILTTLPEDLDLGANPDGVGPTGFWSISHLRTINLPIKSPRCEHHHRHIQVDDEEEEYYVYKIFSPKRPTAKLVADIIGIQTETEKQSSSNSSICKVFT